MTDDAKTARMRKAFEAGRKRITGDKRMLMWDDVFKGADRECPERSKGAYFDRHDREAWAAFQDGVRYGQLNHPGMPVVERLAADESEGGLA